MPSLRPTLLLAATDSSAPAEASPDAAPGADAAVDKPSVPDAASGPCIPSRSIWANKARVGSVAILLGFIGIGCVKRDLPVSEVVGIYESPPDRAVTTVRLNADHSFVMESWTCKTHDVMSGRWEQTGDGYVALSANPRSESEPAKTAEQSGLAEICRLDPQSCAVVRAEDVRVRIVGGVLELQFSSARDYVLKLHRRAQP